MAKVSSATIRLVIRTDKVLSDGSSPIMLRCQFNGRKQVSTGCSCSIRHWDVKNEMVKKSFPNAALINAKIHKMKQDAIDRRNEYELKGLSYTPEMVLRSNVDEEEAVIPVSNDIKGLIDRYTSSLSPTTCKVWNSFWNSFKGYIGKDYILLDELKLSVIKGYAKHMEDRGLKDGTILMMVSKLNALCKFAIDEGIISENPFKSWNFCKRYKPSSNELYIDKSGIEFLKEMFLYEVIEMDGDLWNYKDDSFNKLIDRRSDLFVLGFYLFGYVAQGAAPIDLCKLRVMDMEIEEVNGINYYCWNIKRQKTKVAVKLMISQDNIFANVFVKTMLMYRKGEYLLPILDGVEKDDLKIYKKVSNWLSNHSDVLRDWFKKANKRIIQYNVDNHTNLPLINEKCTFYSYRSSFAMAFMQNGGNLIQLCTLLGRGINASLKSYVRQLKSKEDVAESVRLMNS